MKILGINAASHNTSAALVADGELVAFAEEERFNRERYTMAFPEGAVGFCLDQAGVRGDAVDAVVFAGKPSTEILHSAWDALRLAGRPWYREWLGNQVVVTGLWKGMIMQGRRMRSRFGWTGPLSCLDHHDCHAASAFYCSPFEEAAVLTIDAQGDGVATALYVGRGTSLRRVRSWGFPEHSLGHFYDCVTEWCGFKPVKDAGKTMGLAPYGDPSSTRPKFAPWVSIGSGGARFDLDLLKFERGRRASERFEKVFGPARKPDEDPTSPRIADVAAAAQQIVEEAFFALAREARELTGMRNLCIAGGVGLNSVANGALDIEGIFDEVWIQPAAYDAGLSLGAAFLAWHAGGGTRRFVMEHAYWGPETRTEEVRAALKRAKAVYRETDDPAAEAARIIASNRILGWYQGRAEAGPRSLGNRSILANAGRQDVKEVLNREVKHREPFRPFAPACPLEESGLHFESGRPTPFMLKIWQVKPGSRAILPGITHVDGSARLQTVTQRENALFHRLLVETGRLTGVPVVVNTSFNIRGEPIVNSPMDALKCYFTTGIDSMVIDRFVLEKRPAAAN